MRMKIDDLQHLLERDDEPGITILPDGTVAEIQGPPTRPERRPITFRQELGGEY